MGRFVSAASDLQPGTTFPAIADGIAFGGDYNPEQWPRETWREDVELMQRAGVTSVSVGVFSWGLIEVADGEFEWEWLDEVMGMLGDAGIGVNLATPTAAPPIWLLRAHPEIATVDEYGHRTGQGGRLAWSPSSAVFRRYALRMVRKIAERYGQHPALRIWHVSNEIGNENARCYSDETARAWQEWLENRYRTIDALNEAWGTAFWGHHYTSFAQIDPPRFIRTGHNPGLLLDFERYTSDALLGHFRAEREVLREVTPHIPVTTNFMVMANPSVHNLETWAREVDIVANDHYTIGADPERHVELRFSADRTRGLAQGNPWVLMEHSTAAVNWQGVNRAKVEGELLRDSLSHLARGADGIHFFQWRASTAGTEQYHSAMLPHAGADSEIFRSVEELGRLLRLLGPVAGTRVEKARVALVFDDDAAAALRSGRKPSDRVLPLRMAIALHRAFTNRAIAVDILPVHADLSGYALVVIPTLYLTADDTAQRIDDFVRAGGHALVTYLSGIVDENNRVRTGGYPGAFRDLLGVRVDEFFPLLADESVQSDAGWTAEFWTERVTATEADVLARLDSGALRGAPAYTRNTVGAGTASYLATHPDPHGVGAVVDDLIALADLRPIADADQGLEVVRRHGDGRSFLFCINRTADDLAVRAQGREVFADVPVQGELRVAGGAVAVIEESS